MPHRLPSEPRSWVERVPLANAPWWVGMGAAVALSLLALGARWLVDGALPPGYPFLTFFPAVILASFLFGAGAGVVAAVLSGLLSWYFFIPAFNSFELSHGSWVALAFYTFVVATDVLLVHWMQRANARLERERRRSAALAQTRELLFNELQHRVSNNLQVVAGLIAAQRRQVADPAARSALDEASRRIAVIGRISRQLYDSDGEPRRLDALLTPLCADLVDASGKRVEVTIDDGGQTLSPDASVPVALIVAEAVANAMEHGFAGRDHGRIEIACARVGEAGLRIDVRDDGRGIPDGFDVDASPSLGLRIATMLAGQLGGRFELTGGEGATARLIVAHA